MTRAMQRELSRMASADSLRPKAPEDELTMLELIEEVAS